MADYYIKLTNTTLSGLEYHFDLIQDLNEPQNLNSSVTESNPVENSQATALGFKSAEIQLFWLIYNDGTDKSDGTFSSVGVTDSRISSGTVETIEEQKTYLKRYLFNNNLGAQWRLFGGIYTDPDGSGNNNGTPVTIETLPIRRTSSRSQTMQAQIRMKIAQRV